MVACFPFALDTLALCCVLVNEVRDDTEGQFESAGSVFLETLPLDMPFQASAYNLPVE